MRYLLAIIAPPFALLLCGKYIQFVINLIFWILSFPLLAFFGVGIILWVLCMAHAMVVCGVRRQDKQVAKIVAAIEKRNEATSSANI